MPKAPAVIVVDFETEAIQGRPDYPPVPVGVSIKWPKDRKAKYHAWGHPTENNCDLRNGKRALMEAWTSGLPLLFHHAKFDTDVATTHMGCPELPWELVHDTMYILFLHDPHAMSFQLKPAAQRILGMEPEERDAVREWLEQNKVVRKKQKDWGAYICKAPGALVGTYANGDVDRTLKLFNDLYPTIVERGMLPAYDRERELMPILLENERQGMPCDRKALDAAIVEYSGHMNTVEQWLRKRLKSKDLDFDSDVDVADALERCGIVTEWVLTPTGQRSVAKKNLTPDMFKDAKVASALGYRNRLQTCMSTFMLPWQRMAAASGGNIYTNWNQVRQTGSGGDGAGARTGRMSTNPNFQNIPKVWYDKDDGYIHPAHILTLAELPLMRSFITADKGCLFGHRDYNQQELRILAHFEDGALMHGYLEDSRLDVHTFVKGLIHELRGLDLERRAVKIINFGIIYGMGLGKLAVSLHCAADEAKQIKSAHAAAMVDVMDLDKGLKYRGRSGEAIRTWGGREYYVEEPKLINGRRQTFEYKLLNYLIQGSAADCTKQAVINYHKIRKDGRFLVTVHDEINLSIPKKAVKSEMAILREAMETVKFDVPMLSDGKVGPTWGALKSFEEKARAA